MTLRFMERVSREGYSRRIPHELHVRDRDNRRPERLTQRAFRKIDDSIDPNGGGSASKIAVATPAAAGALGALARPATNLAAAARATLALPVELGVFRETVQNSSAYSGGGFHVVAVPDPNGRLPNGFKGVFGLLTVQGKETLNFDPPAVIVNHGMKGDTSSAGIDYSQVVVDATSGIGLHKEKGTYLNSDGAADGNALRRSFRILRGAQVDAIGTSRVIAGAPQIPVTDATPFTIDASTGARVNDINTDYLAPYNKATLPAGTPVGSALNPALVLQAALDKFKSDGVTITSTREHNYVAIAPEGLGGKNPVGTISNTEALANSAKVVSFKSTEWLVTGTNADGTPFQRLLKLQEHQVLFAGIIWPHIHTSILEPTSAAL